MPSQFQIKSRWSGRVIFKAEISAEIDAPFGIRLGLAVKLAYSRGADLRGADLRGADLRGADLRGAVLRDADLRGADLRGADLRGVAMTDAELDALTLRKLLEEITPGETWVAQTVGDHSFRVVASSSGAYVASTLTLKQAILIALSPKLATELAATREELERLRGALSRLTTLYESEYEMENVSRPAWLVEALSGLAPYTDDRDARIERLEAERDSAITDIARAVRQLTDAEIRISELEESYRKWRMMAAGAVGVLCEVSVRVTDEDEKESLINCVGDWCEATGWQMTTILDRVEIDPPEDRAALAEGRA